MTGRRELAAPVPGTASRWPEPAPGAAPLPAMIIAQAGLETRTVLRNGEQLLLTLIIPVLLLAAFSLDPQLVKVAGPAGGLPGPRHHRAGRDVHGIHQPGHRDRLRAPVRGAQAARVHAAEQAGLIAAKTLTVIAIELVQAVVIVGVGLALGWQPHGGPAAGVWVVLLVLAGTAAFSGLALLLAGTLRAEATLAVANLIYLVCSVWAG